MNIQWKYNLKKQFNIFLHYFNTFIIFSLQLHAKHAFVKIIKTCINMEIEFRLKKYIFLLISNCWNLLKNLYFNCC